MKIAVTGAAGDFGTAILRRLVADDRVDELVALDLREPRIEHEKPPLPRPATCAPSGSPSSSRAATRSCTSRSS